MTEKRILKIATRKSPLAMQQAQNVKESLLKFYPLWDIQLIPMETAGDNLKEERLAAWGGKGLFVKELEMALLEGHADIAVHSMKDVPAEQPEGLEIGIVCLRDDPRDVLISKKYTTLEELPPKARVGTASLRRQCQLRGLHADLDIQMLRGNIHTRLARLEKGDFDAIVLASAGLQRMKLEEKATQYFSVHQMLPSAGQGVIGIECRIADTELKAQLQVLHDVATSDCLLAERAMTEVLNGNCRAPIGAYCERVDEQLILRGFVGTPEGDITLYCCEKGDITESHALGKRAAQALIEQGALVLLENIL